MDPKMGRNALCRCGSGKKYKHCCLTKDEEAARAARAKAAAEAPAPTGPAAPAEPPPQKHPTDQTWKKSGAPAHGYSQTSLPRKTGGG